jgi:hypothetical protein
MLALRNRFGIPGVISVIALLFAMLGGAYAASNSSDGGKATASAKAKRGPRGPKGATGPAGPAGPQGPAGPNGKDGANGSAGIQGSQGLPGKSVAVANYSGPECPGSEEGATVEVSGEPSTKKYVCDGVEGPQGPDGADGEPWVAGTAPKGATLKGTWSVHSSNAAAGETLPVSISFSVPVARDLTNFPAKGFVVIMVPPGGPDPSAAVFGSPSCTGDASNPTGATGPLAGAGVICAYADSVTNLTLPSGAGILTAIVSGSDGGAVVQVQATGGIADGYGSWALIAP